MMSPTVSVIVPAYNAAAHLGRSLASLRAQTFRDFEAVVIDDGSTDDTAEVAAQVAAKDSRFSVIRQENAGVAAARNRGLAEARGRYLANLDADDLWRPQFLARTVAALEAAGPSAAFAFARTRWIGPDDALLDDALLDDALLDAARLAGGGASLAASVDYRELLLRNPIGNGSASLMQTAHVRRVGGYDEALVRDFGNGEDWLLSLQLAQAGEIVVVDEPLVLYRIAPGSSSHAVERAAKAACRVIARCAAEGPRLPRRDYWAARSLALLWLARRARSLGRLLLCLRLLASAYFCNPLWFALPELRAPFVALFRRLAWPRQRPTPRPAPAS
jgi:glycosyltransferase involved in cell wall biosynthesis